MMALPTILSETAHAGTKEWLEASKNMIIVAYVGHRAAVPTVASSEAEPGDNEHRLTHLRETVDAFRYFFSKD